MTTELALRDETASVIEDLITKGDLDKLTPEQRSKYYVLTCESLGLNPLTKPFEYLRLQGQRLTLYATRTATDQLRGKHGVSIRITGRDRADDLYIVTAQATLPDGRSDESTGAVAIRGLSGDALANALLKAETKAKRRVTLSICGLGWMDESEVSSVPGAQRVAAEPVEGRVIGRRADATDSDAVAPNGHQALLPADLEPPPADDDDAPPFEEPPPVARPTAATPAQLETIARMGRQLGRAVDTKGLSKAQASEVITKLSNDLNRQQPVGGRS